MFSPKYSDDFDDLRMTKWHAHSSAKQGLSVIGQEDICRLNDGLGRCVRGSDLVSVR